MCFQVCKDIGYDDEAKGLDYKTMQVLNKLEAQSPDIGQAVHGMNTKSAAPKWRALPRRIHWRGGTVPRRFLIPIREKPGMQIVAVLLYSGHQRQ